MDPCVECAQAADSQCQCIFKTQAQAMLWISEISCQCWTPIRALRLHGHFLDSIGWSWKWLAKTDSANQMVPNLISTDEVRAEE